MHVCSKIPLIWHAYFGNREKSALEESSPQTENFAFYQDKALSVKEADFWHMFQEGLQGAYILNRCGSP
jgi:hypothetical protein